MGDTGRFDFSFLAENKDELEEDFRIYLEDINPLIIQFEITKNEFPVEVQNEIRAMYGHMIRAAMAETPEVAKSNISKMKAHSKRALLDCFKYCCVIYTDQYEDFFKRYDGVDLSYLDEGRFLTEVHEKNIRAKQSLLAAKELEVSNTTDDQLFIAYQDAFNLYGELCRFLDSMVGRADFLKNKATKKEKLAQFSFAAGIVGVLVGIVGIIISLL